MPTDAERIAELERELVQLKGQSEDRPLTIAEIRKLSPEEARERWERVSASLARHEQPEQPEPAGPEPVGVDRLRAAYAERRHEAAAEGEAQGEGERS